MNFIAKWFLERKLKNMLTKLIHAVEGSKTYILAALGVSVAVLGHFFGPFSIGTLTVPAFSWNEVWDIVWNGGLFAFLRMGVKKTA